MKAFVYVLYNSIKHADENPTNCDGGNPMEIPGDFDKDVSVVYTYSVSFEVVLKLKHQ